MPRCSFLMVLPLLLAACAKPPAKTYAPPSPAPIRIMPLPSGRLAYTSLRIGNGDKLQCLGECFPSAEYHESTCSCPASGVTCDIRYDDIGSTSVNCRKLLPFDPVGSKTPPS